MKSLSASIVLLAGLFCFAAGGFVGHNDTQSFMMFVGGVVAAAGFAGWAVSMFRTPGGPRP